jgi:hypothetical protein
MLRRLWKAVFHLLMVRTMTRPTLTDTEQRVRAAKRLIHEALTIGATQDAYETVGVVPLAFVEAENLLVNVGVKMEGSRSDIGSVKRPLQAGPTVLDSVRVDDAFAIGHEMVNEDVLVGP